MKDSNNILNPLTFTIFGCGVVCGFVLGGKRTIATAFRKASILTKLPWKSDYKLVLVVRNDLKMGKGKICAQCSHASVLAYKQILSSDPAIAESWETFGQGKIVVQTDSEHSLLQLAQKATDIGLLATLVCDAGRTQIASGTKTVLAIGPGRKDHVDQVTGGLKLL